MRGENIFTTSRLLSPNCVSKVAVKIAARLLREGLLLTSRRILCVQGHNKQMLNMRDKRKPYIFYEKENISACFFLVALI